MQECNNSKCATYALVARINFLELVRSKIWRYFGLTLNGIFGRNCLQELLENMDTIFKEDSPAFGKKTGYRLFLMSFRLAIQVHSFNQKVNTNKLRRNSRRDNKHDEFIFLTQQTSIFYGTFKTLKSPFVVRVYIFCRLYTQAPFRLTQSYHLHIRVAAAVVPSCRYTGANGHGTR